MAISVSRTEPPSRRSGGKVVLLGLGTFAVGTDTFVIAGFLPAVSAELDVSVATAGQSVTVFAIAYAVLSPIVATLTGTIRRRQLLTLALGVLTVANIGCALAPTFPLFIAARIAAAAGAAAFTPNAGAVASDLVPAAYRGRALAIVISGLTVATAVGVPLGTLASQVMGWRAALALVALVCLAVAVGLRLFLPDLEGGPKLPLGTRLSVLRVPAVRLILPVTVLAMTAAYTAYAYAVPAFEAVGVSTDNSQWMLFVYGVGAIAGAQASGRLTDRFSGPLVLTTGYTTMAGTLLVFGVLASWGGAAPAVIAILAFAWGATSWCGTPPQQHRLIDAAPKSAPLVIALNSSAIYIGVGVGTLIGGLVGAARIPWMFFSGAIIALLAVAFLAVTRRAVARPRG